MTEDYYTVAGAASVVYAINFSTVPETGLRKGATVISLVNPTKSQDKVDALKAQGINLMALDLLPRMLSRAQAFDVLSSMANIAGYRAVVEAQGLFQRFFQAQTTAAGSQRPAKVLVIGAGVAGLAAIQQAKAQGATVRAFDVRQTCREQVEAVGGEFLVVPGFEDEDGAGAGGYAKEISQEFIAAENGGNVEGCVPGETVTTPNGAIICGKYPLANEMAGQASTLFSNNVLKFYKSMGDKEDFYLDKEDDAVRGTWLLHETEGELERYIPEIAPVSIDVPEEEEQETEEERVARQTGESRLAAAKGAAVWCAAVAALAVAGAAVDVSMITVFALSCLAGAAAVRGVAPALHSPLMSLTNAISGLTIIGGLLLLGQGSGWSMALAPLAVFASAMNIGGGFLMTTRMIGMFKREGDISTFPEFNVVAIAGLVAALGAYGAVGLALGAFVGAKAEVTDLPQLVALFHSFVGLSAVASAVGDFMLHGAQSMLPSVYAAALIGSLTVSGSLVAFAKLQGLIGGGSLQFPGQKLLNAALVAGSLALGAQFMAQATLAPLLGGTAAFFVLGYILAAQVGGGDMPIVITLLNSASGWALAAEGFALNNALLVTVGSLIGASGLMLSLEMCEAMGAKVLEVVKIVQKQGAAAAGGDAGEWCDVSGNCYESDINGVATKLKEAKKVVIVPGYGLAVAKAQYATSEIVSILKSNGADVKFMIHPVAGRLPGQLNVLLAEAGVDYDDMLEMDDHNDDADWSDVDLVVVAGANDTVNPLAETEPRCELYGMPVVRAWEAKEVVMLKRSLGIGYAGVPNPLMYNENTVMLLGDAKCNLVDLRNELAKMLPSVCEV